MIKNAIMQKCYVERTYKVCFWNFTFFTCMVKLYMSESVSVCCK